MTHQYNISIRQRELTSGRVINIISDLLKDGKLNLEAYFKTYPSSVTPEQREVLKMRCGIGMGEMSRRQVADILHIIPKSVQLLEKRALENLLIDNPDVELKVYEYADRHFREKALENWHEN